MSALVTLARPGGRVRARDAWTTAAARIATVTLYAAFAITLILSLAATPRRTGDAHQYIAMAIQLSRLSPPSLSPTEAAEYRAWLESQPTESGFPGAVPAIRQAALVTGDRQEFSHLWFYPLLVAPFVAVTNALGTHPLAAFTIVNAALLGTALWVTSRAFGALSAFVILGSPIVWFVGRAQVEVFTLSMLCLAMAAASQGRWGWAAIAAAIASTQNAPIAAAVPLFWLAAISDWIMARRSAQLPLTPDASQIRQALRFAAGGLVIAMLHPAYYLVRLGVLTPQQLNGGITGTLPSFKRFFAPIVDPDIGLVAWFPVATVLALVGAALSLRSARGVTSDTMRERLPLLCSAVLAIWFLFVFAQTTNVNSGGTVHISRYALWLLPLALPALAFATRWLLSWVPVPALMVTVALFAAYLRYFHPDQPERYVEHSPQATWIMAHVPALYDPLPEIFVERMRHFDGGPRASVADPACRLILVVAAEPEQGCMLTASEQSSVEKLFNANSSAIWVRRADNGESAIVTALPES